MTKTDQFLERIAQLEHVIERVRALHAPMEIRYPLSASGATTVCQECRYDGMHQVYPCATIVRLNNGVNN